MKDNSAGSWSECDGCERDAPYAEDLHKNGWRRSDELDLDLCPCCYDKLSDFQIMELSWAKLSKKCRGIGRSYSERV
jgi:hypothetical protein